MVDLSGLKVGDEIAVTSGRSVEIRRVVKVFKRYIVDHRRAEWSMSGGQRPRDSWSTSHAYLVTDALRQKAADQADRARCQRLLLKLLDSSARNPEISRKTLAALEGIDVDDAA